MPLPPLDLTLPTDSIRIVPWPDPVLDDLGHDPRSAYAERFWLPIIGPSTYLLLRRLAAELEGHPEGFDLGLLDGAKALGLGTRGGRNAPFVRAIARSIQFKICRYDDRGTLTVRRRLAPLTRPQVSRLSPVLIDEHDAWQQAELARPGPADQQRRARRLALSLAELGEPDEAIEQQLHRWQLHPALAHEALRWARQRQRDAADAAPVGPVDPAAPAPPVAPVAPMAAARRPVPPPPPRGRPRQSYGPDGEVA